VHRATSPSAHRTSSSGGSYTPKILRLLRSAILGALCLLTISLVVAIARPETGPIEDVVLVGMVVGVLALTVPAHRIGAVSH
jgi:hypothetical protein